MCNGWQPKASLQWANNCCNIAVNQVKCSKPCSEQTIKRKNRSRANTTKTLNCHMTIWNFNLKYVKFKSKSEVKVFYLLVNQSDGKRRRWLKLSLNFSSYVFRRNCISMVAKYKSFPILYSFITLIRKPCSGQNEELRRITVVFFSLFAWQDNWSLFFSNLFIW